ncbi:MAG: tRNA uridine-5-carboxymethylaminomethyl(34) synthesis GTPase MnmE, partial [Bacteroidales bacterium]|nr:tRNA uridine-5-carboxymethylaminomethyl(34) synthesis GTPase MnmE [Bacteroidales bacterium]
MNSRFEDTIVAPATIPGTGAISIIRISGPECFSVVDAVVSLKSGTVSDSGGYTIHLGDVEGLDDVLVSVFRAPHSYTGEDSVEISCHASLYIVSELIRRLVAAGCRIAGPGEFTQRAFLNGKMDLAQAEAVADLISSSTEAAHRIALHQLKGGYSSELANLRNELLEMTSLLELELDFSEEDVEFADRSRLLSLVDTTRAHLERLIDSFRLGNAIKNGIPVAIIGPANAGKSTLLNSMLGEERAIVSDIAGTTRDTIEERLNLDGILFRFIDTAGLRETSEVIERMGIERTFKALDDAEIVLAVVDASLKEFDLL